MDRERVKDWSKKAKGAAKDAAGKISEHVKGWSEKAKGAAKDAAGKITDKKMQAEGKLRKAKGEANKTARDVKDAFRRETD
jgi:uncharacterized protein YjbJ (UPF0337 family)